MLYFFGRDNYHQYDNYLKCNNFLNITIILNTIIILDVMIILNIIIILDVVIISDIIIILRCHDYLGSHLNDNYYYIRIVVVEITSESLLSLCVVLKF